MTAFTKRGEPKQGTKLEVQLTDDSWVTVKVVAKAWSKDRRLQNVMLEDEHGGRQWVPWEGPDGVVWRDTNASVHGNTDEAQP